MRLLNQMLNLLVADAIKSYLVDSYCRIWLIQMSHLKAVISRIKLSTYENRRLNWVMITLSSITKNTGRHAMIHTAFFIFLYTLLSIYHIMLLAICTTQIKREYERETKR